VRSLKHKRDNEIQSSESVVYKVADKKYNPELIDIEKHLGKLDIKYVDVLKALFFVGYTQQETCEQLNIPLGTVKTRLKIGLRELRKFYIESPILQVLMWISVL
jgi:RNA polymerase sigma-70 factor (ECF subfamily)